MLPIEFEGLLAVRAFRNHNHIGDSVDKSDETLTHDRLVVNHHYFDLVVIHSKPGCQLQNVFASNGSVETAMPPDVRKASGLSGLALAVLGYALTGA
jgi:hypothetical protein